jgi:hypothetical protein
MFGVDRYGDHHNTNEYLAALHLIGFQKSYTLLRCTFAEAYAVFDDGSLDFVYVDGYAHTGEDGGRTIFDWGRKVRVGGVLAGHDYDAQKWPLVVRAVDEFVAATSAELIILSPAEEPHGNDKYASWVIKKQHTWPEVEAPVAMLEHASRFLTTGWSVPSGPPDLPVGLKARLRLARQLLLSEDMLRVAVRALRRRLPLG